MARYALLALSMVILPLVPAFAGDPVFLTKDHYTPSQSQPQTNAQAPAVQAAVQAAPAVQAQTPQASTPVPAPADAKSQAPAAAAPGSQGGKEAAPAATFSAPAVSASGIIDIQPSDNSQLYSMELRDADLIDLFRVLAHDYKLNLMVDKDVAGKITASLSNITLDQALSEIAVSQNLLIQKENNVIRISPNLVSRVFVLKYVEASTLLSQGSTGGSGAKTTSTIFDLISDKGKILLGNIPNSIMVIDYPQKIADIEKYINAIDKQLTKKVFKMKYVKASEVLGDTPASSPAPAGH
ncbi:MAG: hypothetical protein ACM3OC_00175 [Deltaproteobacteria bacterium]